MKWELGFAHFQSWEFGFLCLSTLGIGCFYMALGSGKMILNIGTGISGYFVNGNALGFRNN